MGSIQPPRWEAKDVDPSPLGQQIKFPFAGTIAPNRFIKGAMSERLSSWSRTDVTARGIPSPEYINLYKHWSDGQIGVILTGNIMFEYDHLEAPGNAIVPKDAPFSGPRFDAFAATAAAGKAHGSLMIGQVSHPGRQVPDHVQKDPVSASDVQLVKNLAGMTFAKPHPASKLEIAGIVDGWAHTAEYLYRAGFNGIQLHGAHGYLLAQFLSETTNRRTDEYGGSIQNRARIIIEIAAEIRKRVPASTGFVLGIKINSVEFQEKGLTTEEARTVSTLLEEAGFDFIELSGGTYEQLAFLHRSESSRKREAFFLTFADLIAPALTKTKVYVTGGFHTVEGMINALSTCDGIGLGRPLCHEPDLCGRILAADVNAAVKVALPEDNAQLNTVLATCQIKLIGEDFRPVDMTCKETVDKVLGDIAAQFKELQENPFAKATAETLASAAKLKY